MFRHPCGRDPNDEGGGTCHGPHRPADSPNPQPTQALTGPRATGSSHSPTNRPLRQGTGTPYDAGQGLLGATPVGGQGFWGLIRVEVLEFPRLASLSLRPLSRDWFPGQSQGWALPGRGPRTFVQLGRPLQLLQPLHQPICGVQRTAGVRSGARRVARGGQGRCGEEGWAQKSGFHTRWGPGHGVWHLRVSGFKSDL